MYHKEKIGRKLIKPLDLYKLGGYNIGLRFITFKEKYMYAIVKTGGKQYKVAPGDILAVEKLDVAAGEKVELEAICVVDGDKVDVKDAANTKVEAIVLDQFKGEKQLVFKFKKRKGYKKLRGHRQNLTRIQIESVGGVKADK